MYNRFAKNSSTKLGISQILQSGCELSEIMCNGLQTAIPIWEMLSMSEEAYMEKYHKLCVTDASGCDISQSETETETETET